MASISNDGNGFKRILFTRPIDGKRVAIRLGKVSARDAKVAKEKLEAIVSCSITGTSPPDEISHWLATIGDHFHGELAKHGLLIGRRRIQLGEFLDKYIAGRKDVKDGTAANFRMCRDRLLSFFTADRYLHEITPGDAEAWMVHLRTRPQVRARSKTYAGATIGKTVKNVRQFFAAAVRMQFISANPFQQLVAPGQTNKSRQFYVSRETIEIILSAETDVEFRLIIALNRYGGLRCPSEPLELQWEDVSWLEGKIRVTAPKKEKVDGGERWIPIFPELRPHLVAAFEASKKTGPVVTQYRDPQVNMRKRLGSLLRRVGIAKWPKLFQNLRSSCEVDLLRKYPLPVVCTWIGHSADVAMKHYHQMTESDYRDAASGQAAQQQARNTTELSGITGTSKMQELTNVLGVTQDSAGIVNSAVSKVTPTGLEPVVVVGISDNDLRNVLPIGDAKSGAFPWVDPVLLRLTVAAHLSGDIE